MKQLIFTAHNRTDYWNQTLASWSRVRGFLDWSPTVYLEPSSRQDRMIAAAERHGVTVKLNPERYGVSHNPWVGFQDSFQTSTFTILAEDDILVGTDTLEYFHWTSERFRSVESVLAVTAHSLHAPSDDPKTRGRVELVNHFSGLVWGTWVDRWESDLRDTWDHDYSTGVNGGPSGFDWNIQLRVLKGRMCAHPLWGRSSHIGEYGTHVSPSSFAETRPLSYLEDHQMCEYSYS